ncbi:metallophosphoesterase family protein [Devosia albogilva]|uniref:Metallophosphoesterase family protein n=1 Tax=Devosia albogilva TaxID=429726 RepID=A0ABW5QMH6_9HYPH
MITRLTRLLFGKDRKAPRRPRVDLGAMPSALYVIGDVHGCLDQLVRLEKRIVEDAAGIPNGKVIIMLGDYVDRGPSSAAVLDHLLQPPPGRFRRLCLAGNHEVMMLAHAEKPSLPSDWLVNGGDETLTSYGISPDRYVAASMRLRGQILASHIPSAHIDFLATLPVIITMPGYVFAHAGIQPGVPVERQEEEDLLWMRHDPAAVWSGEGPTLVHGHTLVPEPLVLPGRIAVDTGCFATGVLTALRLVAGEEPRFLSVGPR